MSLSWLFIAAFLLPPLNLLLVAAAGFWLLDRRRRLGRAMLMAGLGGIWLLSTPLVANTLLDSLKPSPTALTGREADAIVILGGGRNRDSLEYGGDTLGSLSLERVRYGARLAKRLGKPVLVTGGKPGGGSRSEGELLRDALRDEFGIRARWVETASRTTRENAAGAARLLKESGIQRIYLVTHAWHLPRAIPEFEAHGLSVVPAGIGYYLAADITPLDFLPNGRAMERSYFAMHEWIGLLWYRIQP